MSSVAPVWGPVRALDLNYLQHVKLYLEYFMVWHNLSPDLHMCFNFCLNSTASNVIRILTCCVFSRPTLNENTRKQKLYYCFVSTVRLAKITEKRFDRFAKTLFSHHGSRSDVSWCVRTLYLNNFFRNFAQLFSFNITHILVSVSKKDRTTIAKLGMDNSTNGVAPWRPALSW